MAAENTVEYPFSAACIIAVTALSRLSSTITCALLAPEIPSITRTYSREQLSLVNAMPGLTVTLGTLMPTSASKSPVCLSHVLPIILRGQSNIVNAIEQHETDVFVREVKAIAL